MSAFDPLRTFAEINLARRRAKSRSMIVHATRAHHGGGTKGKMPLPTTAGFLENLYRMKRDCRAYRDEAEKRGDLREAAEFSEHLERVESMIEMKGGDPEAERAGEA